MFLFISMFICFSESLIAECATPSQYVMQFLKESTTLYRGSQDWKTSLSSSTTIKTIFAKSNNRLFTGLVAWAFYLQHGSPVFNQPDNAASGVFTITKQKEDDTVEILANLVDTEIVKPKDTKDKEQLKKLATQSDSKTETQTDLTTRCTYTHKLRYKHDQDELEKTILSECISKMPIQVLEDKI